MNQPNPPAPLRHAGGLRIAGWLLMLLIIGWAYKDISKLQLTSPCKDSIDPDIPEKVRRGVLKKVHAKEKWKAIRSCWRLLRMWQLGAAASLLPNVAKTIS